MFSSCPGVSGETKINFPVVTSGVFHFLFLTYFLAELGHVYIQSQHCALLLGLLRQVLSVFLKDFPPHQHVRQGLRMTFSYHQHKPFQEGTGPSFQGALRGCYRFLSRCKELFPVCKSCWKSLILNNYPPRPRYPTPLLQGTA